MSSRYIERRRRLSWVRDHLTARFSAVEDAFTACPPTNTVGHDARAGVKEAAIRFKLGIDSMGSAPVCLWDQFWDSPSASGPADSRTLLEFVLGDFKRFASGQKYFSDDACADRRSEMDRAVSFLMTQRTGSVSSADGQPTQVGGVIATLRARLEPTCVTLVEQLKSAFNVTEQRFQGVDLPVIPGWYEITSQHWIVFRHLNPLRMGAVADADVVAAYGTVAASADRIRPAKAKDRRIAERASVEALQAVSLSQFSEGSRSR